MSEKDTRDHIARVKELAEACIARLEAQVAGHDASKLEPPEAELYDKYGNLLHGVPYESPEYRAILGLLRPAIDHHFAHNRHHPEHFPEGIRGMDLVDLLEMAVDWKAASERGGGMDLDKGMLVNKRKFGLSDDLAQVILNTMKSLVG